MHSNNNALRKKKFATSFNDTLYILFWNQPRALEFRVLQALANVFDAFQTLDREIPKWATTLDYFS